MTLHSNSPTKKRKALIVFNEPLRAAGGMGRVGLQQATVLTSLGWDVEVLGSDSASSPWSSQRFPALNPLLSALQLSLLLPKLSRDVDLVLSHGMVGFFGGGKKRLHLYHGTSKGLAEACREFLTRPEYFILRHLNYSMEWLAGRAAKRLAVSRLAAREIGGCFSVEVLHNAVPIEKFVPTSGVRDGRDFIGLTVGRMDLGKGRKTLAELGACLPREFKIRCATSSLPAQAVWPDGRTSLLGHIAYDQLATIYSSCDYLLNLSRYEGFGLTLIEAWACGIPVVTTKVGIVHELMGEESTFDDMVVEDPDDTDGFVQRIQFLRANPEMGRRQANWGMATVGKYFTEQGLEGRYSQVLKQLGV